MPNAKDITANDAGKPKFLLVGPGGSGKTSQMLTLPGRTFAYFFDPSALTTVRGHDIDYEIFVPGKVSLSAKSLSKEARKDTAPKGAIKEDASETYREWEEDCEAKIASGYFDQFDNICFDSFTTFSDIVMDRILFLNNRVGSFPQQDDWTSQMNTITNVVRTFASMDKLLLFTAHDDFRQDEETKRMMNQIMLTGRLRVKIPLLFSDIWHMECKATPETVKYVAQTRPDRMNPALRCSIKGLDMFQDVTITNWDKPQESGIGKLIREKLGYKPGPKAPVPASNPSAIPSGGVATPTQKASQVSGVVGSGKAP